MIFNEIKKEYIKNSPIVIFGSGPAGLSLAMKLEKMNINSIVIEAGKEFYDEKSQKQYEGKIVGDDLSNLSSSRLRQLGGTSGHWGGWSRPFEKHDYEKWPISFRVIFSTKKLH